VIFVELQPRPEPKAHEEVSLGEDRVREVDAGSGGDLFGEGQLQGEIGRIERLRCPYGRSQLKIRRFTHAAILPCR
jgi:hypothetical protein